MPIFKNLKLIGKANPLEFRWPQITKMLLKLCRCLSWTPALVLMSLENCAELKNLIMEQRHLAQEHRSMNLKKCSGQKEKLPRACRQSTREGLFAAFPKASRTCP